MRDFTKEILNDKSMQKYNLYNEEFHEGILLYHGFSIEHVFVIADVKKKESISICAIIEGSYGRTYIIGKSNIVHMKQNPGLYIAGYHKGIVIENPLMKKNAEFTVYSKDGYRQSLPIFIIWVDWEKIPENDNRLARKALAEFLGEEYISEFKTLSIAQMREIVK